MREEKNTTKRIQSFDKMMQEDLFSNNCLQYSRVDGYGTFNCFAFKYNIHYGLLTILSQATTSGKKKDFQR